MNSTIDSICVDGFIIRKETEIVNSIGSSVNFLLNDGEKINKGGIVAQIYKNEGYVKEGKRWLI